MDILSSYEPVLYVTIQAKAFLYEMVWNGNANICQQKY